MFRADIENAVLAILFLTADDDRACVATVVGQTCCGNGGKRTKAHHRNKQAPKNMP